MGFGDYTKEDYKEMQRRESQAVDIKYKTLNEPTDKEEFKSARPILPERWDLLPAIALREVAEIMYRGQDKHPQNDWKEVDFNSEQSPLNRAIAHIYKASEMAPHSKERTRQLAKAVARLLMQIWWELQKEADNEEKKDEDNI